jgi:hypothetical protein
MTPSIADIISRAQESLGQVWLTNYRSSDGKVANYRLQVHPAHFYPSLINQTIAMLQRVAEETEQKAECPAPAVMQAAATRLLGTLQQRQAAFEEQQKSAAGMPPENPNLQLQPDATLMLRNVEVLETVVVEEPAMKAGKRATAAKVYTPDEQAERWLRANWPLKRYGASFKLVPGKFSSIVPTA